MSKREPLPVDLTDEQLEEFGREMDEIYYETMASRGEKDRLYILRLIRTQRIMALTGRLRNLHNGDIFEAEGQPVRICVHAPEGEVELEL